MERRCQQQSDPPRLPHSKLRWPVLTQHATRKIKQATSHTKNYLLKSQATVEVINKITNDSLLPVCALKSEFTIRFYTQLLNEQMKLRVFKKFAKR